MREAQYVSAVWTDPNGLESGGRHELRKLLNINVLCRTYGTPIAIHSQPSTDVLGSTHDVLTDSNNRLLQFLGTLWNPGAPKDVGRKSLQSREEDGPPGRHCRANTQQDQLEAYLPLRNPYRY
jgi:hypothetical protein